LAWTTQASANPDLRVTSIVRLFEPPPVADDRAIAAASTFARQLRERDLGLVFCLWQCDKENHGWSEGPTVTVSCQSFDLLVGPSPSGKVSFERNENTALRR